MEGGNLEDVTTPAPHKNFELTLVYSVEFGYKEGVSRLSVKCVLNILF